jgi:hypothetical protein
MVELWRSVRIVQYLGRRHHAVLCQIVEHRRHLKMEEITVEMMVMVEAGMMVMVEAARKIKVQKSLLF